MRAMADSTITDALAEQITQPASFSEEGRSEAARTPEQMIAADQYLAGKAAAPKRRRGITFSKLTPPGPTSDNGGTLGTGGTFGGFAGGGY